MKATDLRKGNTVKELLGDWMEVEIIGHSENPDYIFARCETGFGQNGFEGVPLTKNVLLLFGFKFHGGLWWIDEGARFPKIEFAGSHCQLIQNGYIGEPFQYLHQLQNLYHSLTGNDLIYSPLKKGK